MEIILDSTRLLQGDIARCSKCLMYLDLSKLEDCPVCHSPICSKCGHCRCNDKRREIAYALAQDSWVGEVQLY